jgi:hypothetical protein
MTIDCSIAAQDKRRQLLKDLMEKRYSGVSSISDRSRSVTYHDSGTLSALIRDLQQEIAFCDTGRVLRSRRFIQLPYSKYL